MGEGTTMKSVTATTIELIEKEIAMKYLLQVRKQVRAIEVRTFDPDGPAFPRTAESFQNDVTDYLDKKINDVVAGKFLRPKQVLYVGAKKDDDYAEQIRWGSNTDPRPLLVVGRQYEVEREEVHSWHTKLFLLGFENKPFNSIWFVDVT